jgi:hypothetical protein
MQKDDRKECIRTTIYLPRHLHEQAKIMAILTRTNLSRLMRIALIDKIKQLKESQ